ncbi:hypothetical protein KOW79_007478 [Hemibagrus wyckioides]|uniref:Uncharacterized protein n=1 Tax=Hemibagrus wyckioides TaxID=337641 RepID=A0A9D3NVE1_9TELE|nr:hypothetical protein KOW79_007478 [Hemibagrus wyckioides]
MATCACVLPPLESARANCDLSPLLSGFEEQQPTLPEISSCSATLLTGFCHVLQEFSSSKCKPGKENKMRNWHPHRLLADVSAALHAG